MGLGNPGPTYSLTFHNLGFLFLDYHTKKLGLKFKPGKGHFYIATTTNIYFLKPTTFMNLSGIAVKEFYEKYTHISFENLLVIHDDLDLPKFSVKMKFGGSSGGHRGVESIIYALENEDFWRIKIGIGRPKGIEPKEYVLSSIPENELKIYLQLFEDMSEILQNIQVKDLYRIQSEINSLRKKYVEEKKE